MAAKVQNKAETFTFVFLGVIEKEAASDAPPFSEEYFSCLL